MSEESESNKTWLERLGQALLREPQDREQLIKLLHDAKEHELLNGDALQMIEGVMNVSQMQVRDVMIPRSQMVVIDETATPSEALPLIIKARHSRFPVIGESRDKISGILLAKDLLPQQMPGADTNKVIADLARPVSFVPESKRLDVLLKEFRLNRMHMAIVIDEYGGVAGLVTIEDVLEEIVGDIEDEYDTNKNSQQIKKIDNDNFAVQALTPIEDFNQHFGMDIDDEDFDTIGGYLLQQFSHLPKPGESLTLDEAWKIIVIQTNNRGINLLRLQRLPVKEGE